MKNTLLLSIAILTMLACAEKAENNKTSAENESQLNSEEKVAGNVNDSSFYGDPFDYEQAVSVSELIVNATPQDTTVVVTKGEVVDVCQKKGCWMTMALPNNETVRVTFKDYGFFVPKDLDGEVILNGKLTYTETDVETLRHLAEDAGKSEEEIMEITTPETGYSFIAYGVKPVD